MEISWSTKELRMNSRYAAVDEIHDPFFGHKHDPFLGYDLNFVPCIIFMSDILNVYYFIDCLVFGFPFIPLKS